MEGMLSLGARMALLRNGMFRIGRPRERSRLEELRIRRIFMAMLMMCFVWLLVGMGKSLRAGEWIKGFVFGRRRVCSISRLLLNIAVPSWSPPFPIPDLPNPLLRSFIANRIPFPFIAVLTSLEPRVQRINKSIILHQFRPYFKIVVP